MMFKMWLLFYNNCLYVTKIGNSHFLYRIKYSSVKYLIKTNFILF